jgi:hypothetical protein
MTRATLVLSIAATSVLAAASLARAQSADAEALFSEGDSLMKQGKLAQACDSFEASNRVEPRAGTLIRLGECREQNQQLASAWSAYKDALARVKDPKKRDIAQAKVKELEPRLSYLTINVSDANKVDGLAITKNGQPVDSVLWNHTLPANGGDYTIIAKAPGKADWNQTVKVPVEKGKIALDVPRLGEPHKAEPVKPVVTTKPEHADESTPEEPESPPGASTFTARRKLALGVGGVAVAGLAVGVVLGSVAKARESDAFDLCPDATKQCPSFLKANSLMDEARSKALVANVMFGVAGVAAIGAAVLWFTGAPAKTEGVALVPGPGTLTAVGRF